jgi:hypothetical protein
MRGYSEVSVALEHQRERELADQVKRFAESMPPAQIEKEWIAAQIMERAKKPMRDHNRPSPIR